MIRVLVSFHGFLNRYNKGKETLELSVQEGSTIADVIAQTEIPQGEIAFAALNGSKELLSTPVKAGDEIRIFQLVAGG